MKIKELEELIKNENGNIAEDDLATLIRDQNKLLLAVLKKLNKIANLVGMIEHYID